MARLIEIAFGKKWSDILRDQVCHRSDVYIALAAGAAVADPLSVPLVHLKNIHNTASELHRLLTAKGVGFSYSKRHANMWMNIKFSDMQLARPTKFEVFTDQLASLIDVCPAVKAQLQTESGRGGQSTTWELWICGLTSILKNHGLKLSARKDSSTMGPSAGVVLIRELQEQIPVKFRQHTQSDDALAVAIKRAQKRLRVA